MLLISTSAIRQAPPIRSEIEEILSPPRLDFRATSACRYDGFEICNGKILDKISTWTFLRNATRDKSSSLKQFIGLIRATIVLTRCCTIDVRRFSSQNLLMEKLFIWCRLMATLGTKSRVRLRAGICVYPYRFANPRAILIDVIYMNR